MDWTTKVWGRTRHVFASPEASIWELDVVRGGYCSRHRHKTRANLFVVVRGNVQVTTWDAKDRPRTFHLTAGTRAMLRVPAGVWHRFEAVGPAQIVEMYLPDGGAIDENDIERADEGGVRAAA